MLDTNKDKTLILVTGFACNNNCVMCSFATIKQGEKNRSSKEIELEIEKGKEEGFERIEFTGGEPGIRKDIFHLIRYAKTMGFKEIRISTNGRIFYYNELCKKFIENGLNGVNISLHGHTSKLHNAITRTPASFEQTLQGIKNIQKFSNIKLEIASIICRINYKYLEEIRSFIFDTLNIQRWAVLDLIPDGNAFTLYNALSVKLTDLSDKVFDLLKNLPKQSQVIFFDFPLCLFPASMQNSNSISFVVAQERSQFEQRGYHPTRISRLDNGYTDKHKMRLSVCRNCIFDARCGGIWKKYIELYGEDEVYILANKHRCLKK